MCSLYIYRVLHIFPHITFPDVTPPDRTITVDRVLESDHFHNFVIIFILKRGPVIEAAARGLSNVQSSTGSTQYSIFNTRSEWKEQPSNSTVATLRGVLSYKILTKNFLLSLFGNKAF